MTYLIPLPGRTDRLDIVEPNTTSVQRALRRSGLAAYEPATVTTLLTLFEDQGDDLCFFDVGANMGLYALLCAAMFQPSQVHAFEPTPSTVDVMRRAIRANRLDIEVVATALGDEQTTAELYLSAVSDSSNSLVEGFKRSTGTVTVPVQRLDDYVAASGARPNVMKIDVETHEPAVLAGATAMLAEHRPYIVIEVLLRGGRDHGIEITEAMAPFGYSYYRLDGTPSWNVEEVVTGTGSGTDRDWLLAPEPLDVDFGERWAAWRSDLADCEPERNSRVPLTRSVAAALRRGGPKEVVATARRYAAALRRERDRTSS